jgi:probable HAF family extracellular repeat protein
MLRLLTFYGATLALGVVGCSSQDFPTSASGAPISERSARPYTAVDLGSLAGPSGFSSASDINDAGQIVGQSQTGFNSPQSHAVLWTKEGIRDLGVLAGNFSVAAAINPAGVVVGSSQAPYPGHPGWSTTHAFLWKDGVMRDLGTLGGRRVRPLASTLEVR